MAPQDSNPRPLAHYSATRLLPSPHKKLMMQCTGSKRCKEFHVAFLLSILIICNPRYAALAKFAAAYHLQAVSHDIQVSPWTAADISVSLLHAAGFCCWSLSTTFCRRQQTVYSSNTYIYSWATIILGLWAGVLERRSSQPQRPWSVP